MNTSENLFKLAKHIEENMPDEAIDMGHFCVENDGQVVGYFGKDDCGTVRCALGESPNVPGLEPLPDEFTGHPILDSLDYHLYASRVYPELYCSDGFINADWDQIFHCGLSSDKKSVVKRIREKAEELEE